jgi:predicted GH43/DUF377 family glycosyl hydrolase
MFYRAVALNHISTIGYCRFQTPLLLEKRLDKPLLVGQTIHEAMGIEDPRLVRIEGLFYLSYTAFDGKSALGSLLFSKDLIHFYGKRVIVALQKLKTKKDQQFERYRWDKNLVFFPRRINGQIYFMHRIKPHILLSSVTDISEVDEQFWKRKPSYKINTRLFLKSREIGSNYVGAGCPPIETEAGWLLIYHGVHDTVEGYVYCACACILDIEFPMVELARLPYPLFSPEESWEITGAVNNVCFPTGAVVIAGELFIYYGAADHQIACASIHLAELVEEIMKYKIYHENE